MENMEAPFSQKIQCGVLDGKIQVFLQSTHTQKLLRLIAVLIGGKDDYIIRKYSFIYAQKTNKSEVDFLTLLFLIIL